MRARLVPLLLLVGLGPGGRGRAQAAPSPEGGDPSARATTTAPPRSPPPPSAPPAGSGAAADLVEDGAAPEPVFETVVVAPTPLHGSRLPRDRVPANVQTANAAALGERGSVDLPSFLNGAFGSVHVNDVQNNPLQPDLQYRGYLLSPLLGAPQGLSVYLDGVRLNEPFGDTVNWDLLPPNAIRSVNLMPGSNPIFGLNTLGGSLSLETKTGFSDSGAEARLSYGSFGRTVVRASAGGHGQRLGAFAAVQLFDEAGWRARSPSRAVTGMAALSYLDGGTSADLIALGGGTSLTGNGPVPEQLLALDRRSVFTYPDRTRNRSFMLVARGQRPLFDGWRLAGAAYLRESHIDAVNGDQRPWAACEAQPDLLCSGEPGDGATPVRDGAGNPVPFSPGYDAALNTSTTRQHGYGASAQLSSDLPIAGRENHVFAGVAADQARVTFQSSATIAMFGPDRGTIDTGIIDASSSVQVDAVPSALGVYAGDTFALRPDLFLSVSARFNWSAITLDDRLGDALDGAHRFHRLNPAVGLSYQPRPEIGAYASHSESNRAPTPIELTCASPTDPCRLPNGFVADPPLDQVVARTFEVGVRGTWRRRHVGLDYALGAFRTTNAADILFISAESVANRGYFTNVGETRRQGLEASAGGHHDTSGGSRFEWTLRYTLLRATFETPFTAPSDAHPDAVDGAIAVPAGARLPGIPAHVGKLALTFTSAGGYSFGANAVANSGQYLRGDEANRLAPLPGFFVVNLRGAYRVSPAVTIDLLVDNVFDARPATFGVLGDARGVLGAAYTSPRFVGPGAPRGVFVAVEVHR